MRFFIGIIFLFSIYKCDSNKSAKSIADNHSNLSSSTQPNNKERCQVIIGRIPLGLSQTMYYADTLTLMPMPETASLKYVRVSRCVPLENIEMKAHNFVFQIPVVKEYKEGQSRFNNRYFTKALKISQNFYEISFYELFKNGMFHEVYRFQNTLSTDTNTLLIKRVPYYEDDKYISLSEFRRIELLMQGTEE